MAVSRHGARLWDTSTWKIVATTNFATDRLDFDPAGKRLLTCLWTWGESVTYARLYTVPDLKAIKQIRVSDFGCNCDRFSADGKRIICGIQKTSDIRPQQALLIDINSERVLKRLQADFESIDDFIDLPKQKEIAVAVFGHTRRPVVLWKVK